MNLGSPTSAPVGPSSAALAANAASPSTHYLPGYLLGDYSSIGAPSSVGNHQRSWLGNNHPGGGGGGGMGSPPKALHISSSNNASQFASPPSLSQNPSMMMSGRSPGRLAGGGMQLLPSPSVVGRKDFKPGAPPTVGLFDHIQTSPPPAAAPVSMSAATSRLGGDGDSFYGAENSLSASQMGLEGDEFWVTVFGFPPAAASYILQQFSQFGNILKHVIAPNGNWMHLQYQSKLQAHKALSKNGRVFGNNIMVGVSECNDQNVAAATGSASLIHDSFAASSPNSLVNSALTLGASPANVSRTRLSMRPLTSSSVLNASVRDDRDVVNDANAPKKNSGLISKTVDYLFGW